MTNTDLSALSMSELKAIALELNTAPTADKRAKRAWIDAIVLAQATISEAVQETAPAATPAAAQKAMFVDVKSIKASTKASDFDAKEIEAIANSILDAGGLYRPLLVEQDGLDYKLLPGHDLNYHAAARAKQLDISKAEEVNAFIVGADYSSTSLDQLDSIKKADPTFVEPKAEFIKKTFSGRDDKSMFVDVKSISSSRPASDFDLKELEDLADSMLSNGGLLRPMVLGKVGMNGFEEKFEVIDGHMAYHAAVIAKQKDIGRAEMVNAFVIAPENIEKVTEQLKLLEPKSKALNDEPLDTTDSGSSDTDTRYALQVTHDYLANTRVNYIANKFPRLSKAHGWDGSYLCHNCTDSIKNEYCMTFDTFHAAEAYWLAEIEKGYLSANRLIVVSFTPGDDEPRDSTDICGESAPDDDTWELVEKSAPDDDESGDIFGGFGDVEAWEPIGFPTVEQELVSAFSPVPVTIESIASTKKGSVSVAASIVCLLIFALTVVCQILSIGIKYGCLLVMLIGRWNPNLDIWYQLTTRTASKGLSVA